MKDNPLGSSYGEPLSLAATAASNYSFTNDALSAELTKREVINDQLLPHYPYRDDGLLLWKAIDDYVGAYLAAIGLTDGGVVLDAAIQAWWTELAGPARLHGIAPFVNAAALQAFVTHVIFIAGPQHSAVNFPQYDDMAFVPNMPLAAYAPPNPVGATPDTLLKILPPQKASIDQLTLMNLLANYRPDQLGQYPDGTFSSLPPAMQPAIATAVDGFQDALVDIESQINDRNKSREYPYSFLLPSLVTNSVSV